MSGRIRARSATGGIQFDDTQEHFDDAVVRLAIARDRFQPWLDAAGRRDGSLLDRLRDGFSEVVPAAAARPDPGPVLCGPGRVRHGALVEDPSVGLAVDDETGLGFLVRRVGDAWARERRPPPYDATYFTATPGVGGFGAYASQAGWRREKAGRQVRQLADHGVPPGSRVLEIGSAYGYFRAALQEAGYEHAGVEPVAHARAVAADAFGQQTAAALDDVDGVFDAVALWDVIEHVPDAVATLRDLVARLKPGGLLALKTPNLDCPEANVFGAAYHSLKREHLVVFTPRSLAAVAAEAGLDVERIESVSHLLAGFFGSDTLRGWEAQGRGADLVGWFRRAAA